MKSMLLSLVLGIVTLAFVGGCSKQEETPTLPEMPSTNAPAAP